MHGILYIVKSKTYLQRIEKEEEREEPRNERKKLKGGILKQMIIKCTIESATLCNYAMPAWHHLKYAVLKIIIEDNTRRQ
jgi:hypothetical protein